MEKLGENKNIDLIFKRQVDGAVYLLKRNKIAKMMFLVKNNGESSLKAEDKNYYFGYKLFILYQNFLSNIEPYMLSCRQIIIIIGK